jgi:hypothetical protein
MTPIAYAHTSVTNSLGDVPGHDWTGIVIKADETELARGTHLFSLCDLDGSLAEEDADRIVRHLGYTRSGPWRQPAPDRPWAAEVAPRS